MEKLMILHLIVDGERYQTVSVEKGEPVLVSPPPEKEGYTFVRWEGLPERGIAGKEVKATALYTKNEYEVSYLDEYGFEYKLYKIKKAPLE